MDGKMGQEALLGKIIALTKQIEFNSPVEKHRDSFLSGHRSSMQSFGFEGPGLEWSLLPKADQLCCEIAAISIRDCLELQAGDIKGLAKIVMQFFREHIIDGSFFLSCRILSGEPVTVFDCIRDENKMEFAQRVWEHIYEMFSDAMTEWLILYPLVKVQTASVDLGFDGISILTSKDISGWKIIKTDFPDLSNWNPEQGCRADNPSEGNLFQKPPSWVACRIVGTIDGVRREAERRLRVFLGVLLAHCTEQQPGLDQRSSAQPVSYSVQFAGKDNRTHVGQKTAFIGTLLHPLLREIEITPQNIEAVQAWYSRCEDKSELALRALSAARYYNYAFSADELTRFLYLYIALDALFGVRGKVEATIDTGIGKVFADEKLWIERAKFLFDLRSELVHGGSSYIEEWKDFDHYQQRFHKTPTEDAFTAATQSIIQFWSVCDMK